MTRLPSATRLFHILAVEDDAANLHLITASLQGSYQVSVAKTLAKARQLIETHNFDIILLDVMLPDGSGLDLCKEVMQDSDTYGEVRVIFMTGLTSPDDEVKGLNLGAADYIHKPIVQSVLLARVRLQAQLLRRNELLADLAMLDGLTEIPNRRAFDSQLESEWARAQREQKPLVLAIIDIDFFKQYNDYYGHPAGDKCLHEFAQFLKQFFRRSGDFVARYGGEEFTVLLPNTNLDVAQVLFDKAQNELNALAIPHVASSVKSVVSFSAGFCCANPSTEIAIQDFLAVADKQLYLAKESGRARSQGINF